MNEICLPNGRIVLINDSDYETVAPYHWAYNVAGATAVIDGVATLMHRFLLQVNDTQHIVHLNNNNLDNRRNNLKVVDAGYAREVERTNIRASYIPTKIPEQVSYARLTDILEKLSTQKKELGKKKADLQLNKTMNKDRRREMLCQIDETLQALALDIARVKDLRHSIAGAQRAAILTQTNYADPATLMYLLLRILKRQQNGVPFVGEDQAIIDFAEAYTYRHMPFNLNPSPSTEREATNNEPT